MTKCGGTLILAFNFANSVDALHQRFHEKTDADWIPTMSTGFQRTKKKKKKYQELEPSVPEVVQIRIVVAVETMTINPLDH